MMEGRNQITVLVMKIKVGFVKSTDSKPESFILVLCERYLLIVAEDINPSHENTAHTHEYRIFTIIILDLN